MASFKLRHFANAETLRAVRPQFLMALLGRHADYFAERGVNFGAFNGAGPDYEAIAGVLMAPEQPPSTLIDDLYYVDEMATPAGMDALLEAAEAAKVELDLDDEPTPADVAVQVRLRAPALLEQKHAEQVLLDRKRTFVYFQAKDGADTRYHVPGAKRVRAFEDTMGVRLDLMKRGRTCKLFIFPRTDGVWFLVRRGDPYKREGAIEKAKTTSVYYRPEKYDVLKYDEGLGELAINAEGNKKLAEHYRELVGVLLFDDAKHFPDTAKFTLEPLQESGAESLVCSDVEGIDSVVLKELQVYWGGAYGESTTHKAKDLFAAWAAHERSVPKGRLVKASFLVRFTGQKTARSVTIRPSNIASYTRNEDASLVEQWLALRGFVKTPILEAQDADLAPAAAVA
ncbi:MAG: hypothetical protein GQE15_34310 [Archangiaceae bacterium]|nr:hypothetical protein [Archangiaceae bacterium]